MNNIKIVQILVVPDNFTCQSGLLGLGSDGIVYFAGNNSMWEEYFPNQFVVETPVVP